MEREAPSLGRVMHTYLWVGDPVPLSLPSCISFIHSLILSSMHSFTLTFIHSLCHSFITLSFIHSLSPLLPHSTRASTLYQVRETRFALCELPTSIYIFTNSLTKNRPVRKTLCTPLQRGMVSFCLSDSGEVPQRRCCFS